jgi:hypothetical protein
VGEEVAAAVEVRPRAVAEQAQVGFVDQRQELLRGARRLARWRTEYV